MVAFPAFSVGSSILGGIGASRAAKEQAKQLAYQNAVAEQARRDNLSNAAAMTELGAYNMRLAEEQNDYRKELARQQNQLNKKDSVICVGLMPAVSSVLTR